MTAKSIAAWLSDIGLPQYAELFEENGIDLEILEDVTGDHLKEIGVTVLGHRLKLNRAIAALKPDPEQPKPSGAMADEESAERRHLTIMFCDLVGSTSLSARLDPEDYRDLMALYQDSVSQLVKEAGGHVAQYLGDGVVVYFGYPVAQEDAAERACRAALEIVEAVAALDTAAGERLQARIGIATGLVVAGDFDGTGAVSTSAVAGDTPNLAARLQGLAKPGQIVIGNRTHSLLGDMFVYEALENIQLKGFDPGQVAWRVVSVAERQDRFAVTSARRQLTPLVGRRPERARLMSAWDDAKSGKGRVCLVTGEAGIGKSRLTYEVVDQAKREGARVFHLQSAPYFKNTAMYPIRRQIETLLAFTDGDDDDTRLNKLEKLVVAETDLDEARALMASLFSLPCDRYPALNLSPALQKTRTIEMLIEQVIVQAKQAPLLVHFEDLHWVDPTSLELLSSFVTKLADHQVLLLATCRPEFAHEWQVDHLETCELSRLTPAEVEELLDSMTGAGTFSVEQRKQLFDRSDGVPLFVEELTRSVLESKNSADLVPDSLQDSLMARLDKLGAVREYAQIGSVIGREVDIDLLSQVTKTPLPELSNSLSLLAEADLVYPTQSGNSLLFRHALIQEAAYRSILRRRRQQLHAEIAETLEEKFPERCKSGPEQVATHFVAAGLGGRSVPYWLTAGKSAWGRASMKEALAQLSQGLEFVGEIDDLTDRARLELQLQSTIGVVHFAATSYASPQAQAAFERARELFVDVDDPDLRVAVLYGIGAFETMRGDVSAGHETFAALAGEAERSGNARYEVYSASMQAWSHFNRGDYAQSARYGERVLQLYDDGIWDQPGPRLSAAEPKVISECFRAAALWSLGYPDQAEKVGNDILEYTRSLPDPYSLVYALSNGVIRIHDWNGNWEQVMVLTEECSAVAGEYGYKFLGVWASFWRARAMAQLGQLEEAEKMTASAVAACKNAGVHYHRVCFEANHARLLLALDRVEDAARVLGGLEQPLQDGGELNHAIDLSLVKGELAQKRGDAIDAERHYRAAFKAAESRSALSWKLRAALGLASLLHTKDARRALIEPLVLQFEEGFDSRYLKAARAYLS
ncbi:adenylate/guanylate cyclase domain-containing protein [Ruegeria sp. Ofav3-42]|uniref:adenylate/guanylate cyclase domain-containing protein n=1 Tax=Ruegeria sp. Ofav3-42 TaxID=2917759 RepID=UPI001EF58457|nr:adenylate/guanylate cyclase domain-containing protein [Ruegeria sp. Ofav3-42]MCG7522232.1 AAA family ATPase [Ruegeria sp. Ofav3-42]